MELYDILQSSLSQIALSGQGATAYLIPDIPRRLLTKAWHTFCPAEKRDQILAVIDTSFLKNGKEGFVFTQNTLYIKEPFHHSYQFLYKEIQAVIYLEALSTYSGKSSISMEIETQNNDFEISNKLIKKINSKVLNEVLQQIISLYKPCERDEIQQELKDSQTQIAHPEKFRPHEFKPDDPQIYNK